jgi:biotin carboxyl carrier protein
VTASSGKEETVLAPMPGKIMKMSVKAGDKIEKDSLLLTFEAMKMEVEIFAPISGVVREVKVSSGASVKTNDPLVIIAHSG